MTREHEGARQALKEALARAKREFPDSAVVEVGFRLASGEVSDGRTWSSARWELQVATATHWGDSLDEAIAEARKERELRALVPGQAERIAAVLREVPDEGFARNHVLQAVEQILNAERRDKG